MIIYSGFTLFKIFDKILDYSIWNFRKMFSGIGMEHKCLTLFFALKIQSGLETKVLIAKDIFKQL